LQGQEAEAQDDLAAGVAEGEPEQIEQWTAQIDASSANRAARQALGIINAKSGTCRSAPDDVNNLLHKYCAL